MQNTKFFTFYQNNSGGRFDYDGERGITHYVVIEAADRDEVENRAENIGIYFDGVSDGLDCPCCGDRWRRPWQDPTDSPEVWGDPVSQVRCFGSFQNGQKEIAVHYLDGRIEWFC